MTAPQEVYKIAKGIQGWLTDPQVAFLYRTAMEARRGAIVEIGSFCGKSTVVLAIGTRSGSNLPVYAIDPHIGSIEQNAELNGRSSEEIFRQNIEQAGVLDVVTPIVKKSADAANGWNQPIAFLWIDGDHSYEGAKSDFDLFSPWVVEGGVIAFHDCDGETVAKAMARSFRQPGYGSIGVVDTITYAAKGAPKTLLDRAILTGRVIYPKLRNLPGMGLIKKRIKAHLTRC